MRQAPLRIILISTGLFLFLTAAAQEQQKATKLEIDWFNICSEVFSPPLGEQNARFKVGPPYVFNEYHWAQAAGWTLELFVNPEAARGRRVLTLYDPVKMKGGDLRAVIENAGSQESPPLVAVLKAIEAKGEITYIATPVKWNKQFASALRATTDFDEKKSGLSRHVLNLLAEDLMYRASLEHMWTSATSALPKEIYGIQANDLMVFAPSTVYYNEPLFKKAVAALGRGNYDVVAGYEPRNKFYLAFGDQLKGLEHLESGQVISVSGISGEELGTAYPIWPKDLNVEKVKSPFGCPQLNPHPSD